MSATLKQIHIELTNRCNLNCVMCYRKEMSVAKGEMDFILFNKIASQISSIKTIEKVFLHWRGEPTCCSYLPQAVDCLCKKGKNVILFTNGLGFSNSIADSVIRSGIQAIYFSVESTDSSRYALIRGSNHFDELEKTIKKTMLLRDRLQASTKINISTIIFDESVSDIKHFHDYWKQVVDGIEFHVDTRDSTFLGQQQKQCSWPDNGMFVAWNGVVSPCCMDVNNIYPIGDVNDSDILDIFNSEAAILLRKNIKKGVPVGKCGTCNFFHNK